MKKITLIISLITIYCCSAIQKNTTEELFHLTYLKWSPSLCPLETIIFDTLTSSIWLNNKNDEELIRTYAFEYENQKNIEGVYNYSPNFDATILKTDLCDTSLLKIPLNHSNISINRFIKFEFSTKQIKSKIHVKNNPIFEGNYQLDTVHFTHIPLYGDSGYEIGCDFYKTVYGKRNGILKFFDEDRQLLRKENWEKGKLERIIYSKFDTTTTNSDSLIIEEVFINFEKEFGFLESYLKKNYPNLIDSNNSLNLNLLSKLIDFDYIGIATLDRFAKKLKIVESEDKWYLWRLNEIAIKPYENKYNEQFVFFYSKKFYERFHTRNEILRRYSDEYPYLNVFFKIID